MANTLRAVIVGASTLLGKELVGELNSSGTEWDFGLADRQIPADNWSPVEMKRSSFNP